VNKASLSKKTTHIWQVRDKLPEAIKNTIKSSHTDWTAFLQTILAVFAMPLLFTSLPFSAMAQAVHATGLKPMSDWCPALHSFNSVLMSSALFWDFQTALVLLLGFSSELFGVAGLLSALLLTERFSFSEEAMVGVK
jgi:hypothetical protein